MSLHCSVCCHHSLLCLLQEFNIAALFHVLSSLLAVNVTEPTVHFTSDVSLPVLTAVLDVIASACINCDVQSASSLAHSTSM